MAAQPIMHSFDCAQCGVAVSRTYNGCGPKPSLCGNACKKAAYVARHPDRVRAQRVREAAKRHDAVRTCPSCGIVLAPRQRKCAACRADMRIQGNARRRAIRVEADIEDYLTRQVDHAASACGRCTQPVGYTGMGRRRRWCPTCQDDVRRERRDDPERRRTYWNKRAARKRGVRAENLEYKAVFERDGWRCYLCGKATPASLRGTTHPDAPELDHIIPLALNGDHTYANTACCCRACNAAKGASSPTPLCQSSQVR